jgi:hypothetical protein
VLGTGNVLRVPVTHDGQDEILTVVVDQVVSRKGSTQCYLTSEQGGFWIPAVLLQGAIARAEIAIDPGFPTATKL